MSAKDVSAHPKQAFRFQIGSSIWSFVAACLFLVSALLQHLASLQRWVVFRGSLAPEDIMAENDRFDYSFPSEPWENLGTAAQYFGVGTLLQGLGVIAMACGVLALSGARASRRDISRINELILTAVAAASFGLYGTHALFSGITGVPSPLAAWWAIGLLGFPALAALGAWWWGKSPGATIACFFLLGSTFVGYIVAGYLIAPLLAGYTSHDTTPWTETIIAATTAAAGAAMLFASVSAAWRAARLT